MMTESKKLHPVPPDEQTVAPEAANPATVPQVDQDQLDEEEKEFRALRHAVLDAWDSLDDATRSMLTAEGAGLTDHEFNLRILAVASAGSTEQPEAAAKRKAAGQEAGECAS